MWGKFCMFVSLKFSKYGNSKLHHQVRTKDDVRHPLNSFAKRKGVRYFCAIWLFNSARIVE